MLCFVLIFLFTKPALVLFACSGPLIFGKTGGRERLLGATSYLESELLQLELCSNRIMVTPVTQPPVLDANSSTRIGSSSNAEVNNHDETEVLAVAERLPVPEHQGENLVEMDFFFSGDFLELQDLDNPASSSSSENSSAVSNSSDECFDSMAFLQDLDDQILEQNDASKKLNVSASNNLDEVVIVPATLGSLVSVEGSNSGSDVFFKTAGSATISASGSRDLNKKVAKHAKGDERGEEGPSSPTRKPSTSSESHTAAAGGRKRAAFGGMKKLGKKFMPF